MRLPGRNCLVLVIYGRPLQVTIRPMIWDRCPLCLSALSACNVGVLWPYGWMDQDATWYVGRPRPRRHCVRRGPSSPTEREQQLSHFSAHVYCGQTVAHLSNCRALVKHPRPFTRVASLNSAWGFSSHRAVNLSAVIRSSGRRWQTVPHPGYGRLRLPLGTGEHNTGRRQS